MKQNLRRAVPAILLAAALLLQSGCAVIYYQKARDGDKVVTEAGLLGIPNEVKTDSPGGLLPLYRSTVPYQHED